MNARSLAWPLIVAALGISLQVVLLIGHPRVDGYSKPSFRVASDLLRSGIYTNGISYKGNSYEPGYSQPPGLPVMTWLMGQLNPRLESAVRCHGYLGRSCEDSYGFPFFLILQFLTALISALLIFYLSWKLSDSRKVAWLTLALMLLFGRFSEQVWSIRPTVFFNLAFYCFISLIIAHLYSRRNILAALAGLALGIATLFHPPFNFLAFAMLLILPVAHYAMRHEKAGAIYKSVIAFTLGGGIVLLPWALRNSLLFDDFSLTAGYEGRLLAVRVAYNSMSAMEWMAASVNWIAEIGEILARAFVPEHVRVKLYLWRPGSFTYQASEDVFPSSLAAAGSTGKQYAYLFRTEVMGNFMKHLMVTVPLISRGIFDPGGLIALIGVFFLWPMVKILKHRQALTPYLVLFFTIALMIMVQAFLTPNSYVLNLPTVFLFAYTISYVSGGV